MLNHSVMIDLFSVMSDGRSVDMNAILESLQSHPLLYKEQKVLTLAMVDDAHEHKSGNARKRFNRNKDRFFNDRDYWLLTGSALRTLKTGSFVNAKAKSAILLSERGYLKLAKTFRDNLSWEIQDKLIDCYFRIKEQSDAYDDPSRMGDLLEQAGSMIKTMNSFNQSQVAMIQQQSKAMSEMASNAAAIMSLARWHRAPNPHQQPLPFSASKELGKH